MWWFCQWRRVIYEPTLTPTSAISMQCDVQQTVTRCFSVLRQLHSNRRSVSTSCFPDSGCRPYQRCRYRPVYTGLGRIRGFMQLSVLTRATRQYGAAKKKWDWPQADDVYLSTTISGNQFAALLLSSDAETFTYFFVCQPAPQQSDLRTLLFSVRSFIALQTFHVCRRVFPTERDWSHTNHRNRFVTSADHIFTMNLLNLAIFSWLSTIAFQRWYWVFVDLDGFREFRFLVTWISIISIGSFCGFRTFMVDFNFQSCWFCGICV